MQQCPGPGGGALLDALVAAADRELVVQRTGTDLLRLDEYLQVPASGAYRFFPVIGKQGARAELRFAHLAV